MLVNKLPDRQHFAMLTEPLGKTPDLGSAITADSPRGSKKVKKDEYQKGALWKAITMVNAGDVRQFQQSYDDYCIACVGMPGGDKMAISALGWHTDFALLKLWNAGDGWRVLLEKAVRTEAHDGAIIRVQVLDPQKVCKMTATYSFNTSNEWNYYIGYLAEDQKISDLRQIYSHYQPVIKQLISPIAIA
jgi:hypothetical protein